MEEERKIKGKKIINQPTKEEYDDHMRTHIAFRKWCPFCAKGKRKNDPHRSSKDKEEQEVPTMSRDYEEQRGKKGIDGTLIEREEEGRNKNGSPQQKTQNEKQNTYTHTQTKKKE